MSEGKLNIFIRLLHCKTESCNIFSLPYDMILSYLQCNRQINAFSLPCDMILSYNVIEK
jgi:hypothetical protein